MSMDERITQLTESQQKTQLMLVQIADSIQPLERITSSHRVARFPGNYRGINRSRNNIYVTGAKTL